MYILVIWVVALSVTTQQMVPLQTVEIPGFVATPATATAPARDALTNCLVALDSHIGAFSAVRAGEKDNGVKFIAFARCERGP